MGCVASENGGCFCTGACQKPFPSTNPDEFANRIRDWQPGEGACEDCGKTEAECFCVEPVEPGEGRFDGVFIDEVVKQAQDNLSEAAVEADKDLRKGTAAPTDTATSEYRVTIRHTKVDGHLVYEADHSTYTTDGTAAGVSGERKTYIGTAGLERLLNELRVNLREVDPFS